MIVEFTRGIKVSRLRVAAVGFLALVWAVTPGMAETFPSKNIRLIVPQGAGGMADMVGRILANDISQSSGQNVVVENRAGGGTMIGSDVVAKAAPDGYTLLLGTVSLAILPAIDSTLPFNPEKDLIPITLIADVPNVLLVHSSVPVKSLQELIDYAKKNPGKLSYASQGMGTTGHMAAELFKQVAGIDITHVPYRGSAPAAQDLIAGHVHLLFDALPLAVANLKNDSVRALAIAAPKRADVLPDVPTMAESGLPAVQTSAWFGLYAPAKTPEPIVKWLNDQAVKSFSAEETRKRLLSQGASLPLLQPEAFTAYMAKDAQRWSDVAKVGKISAK